jgi:hypothetical protein
MQTAVLVFVQVAEREILNMKKNLTPEMRLLLEEVVCNQQPSFTLRLDNVYQGTLTDDERRIILDALSKEFCATGLGPDDEPNARGIQLESLIDLINPIG